MRAQAGRAYCFHSFINLAQGNIYRRSRVYSLAAAFYAAVSFLHTRRIEIDFDQADGVRLDGHRKINTRSAPFHSLFFNPVSLSLSFPFSLSLRLFRYSNGWFDQRVEKHASSASSASPLASGIFAFVIFEKREELLEVENSPRIPREFFGERRSLLQWLRVNQRFSLICF